MKLEEQIKKINDQALEMKSVGDKSIKDVIKERKARVKSLVDSGLTKEQAEILS